MCHWKHSCARNPSLPPPPKVDWGCFQPWLFVCLTVYLFVSCRISQNVDGFGLNLVDRRWFRGKQNLNCSAWQVSALSSAVLVFSLFLPFYWFLNFYLMKSNQTLAFQHVKQNLLPKRYKQIYIFFKPVSFSLSYHNPLLFLHSIPLVKWLFSFEFIQTKH